MNYQNRNNQQLNDIQQFIQPEYQEEFQAPIQNNNNQQIYHKYQNQNIINQQPRKGSEQFSFIIKNLDTGEIQSIKNREQQRQFDEKNSYKRKQLKGLTKIETWQTFWKCVYQNNQELRKCAEKGDLENIKSIILKGRNGHPVQINSPGWDNWTALHYASYENHYEIVKFLLQNEANINAVTRFQRTALHISTIRGHIQTIKILCQSQIDINRQDQDGNTALHFASQNNYFQIVEILLNHMTYMVKNKYSQSPLDLSHSQETKQLFKKFKIKVKDPDSKKSPSKKQNISKENKIQTISLPTQSLTPSSFYYYKLLGKGSFGQVFLVSRKGQDKFYALKILDKQKIFGKDLVRYAMTERNILKAMNHPFIVKLHYAFQNQSRLFLVMDYCPGGDLGKLLKKKKQINQSVAKLYISQIILAFQALHKNMIVFRDLKPDNVVLDQKGHALLTDFGLSKQGIYNNITESFCGSTAYLAPQVLTKQGHSRTIDWYLVGLLVYQLLVGMPPYFDKQKNVLFDNIKKAVLILPKQLSEPAKDLIKRLLCRDPNKRLGSLRDAQQLKQHPFFEGIFWNDVLNRKLEVPPIQTLKINTSDKLQVNFDSSEKSKKIDNWTFINNFHI